MVFKRGDYQEVITQGTHWVGFRNMVKVYDLTKAFMAPIALEILLKDQGLEAMFHIIEVKDAELALVFENGNLKSVLTAGKYAFWKGLINYEFVMADLSKIYITEAISKAMLSHSQLRAYVRTLEVAAYEKAVLFG